MECTVNRVGDAGLDPLEHLAGSEVGAGVFAADTLPEAKAAERRAVEVSLA